MKIAILGGGNPYALNLACALNAQGIDHFGIGRSTVHPPAFWQVEHHYRYWQIHLVDQMEAALAVLDTEKPDIIVNFAAQGEGQASFSEFAYLFYRTNCVGLVRLVHELRSRDYLKRFIQIGTSELYGPVDHPAKETDPLRPSSPYAISKAAFDQHLQVMAAMGFPMNIVRPSNCYCAGQQAHRIIPKAIICALGGKKLELHGGGKAHKSYLHADDLSRAIIAVVERGKAGEIYNVGPVGAIAIKVLVAEIAEQCGISFEELVNEAPERPGQDSRYWLDSTKIARDCGWTQTVGLAQGLKQMIAWVRKYPELLTMDTSFKVRP